ncbi:TetR family transcriptional regulator [Saprospiraceae bacterium]
MIKFNAKQIEIMKHALSLFAEHGYEKTSVRDLAKKAKINIAMISYYFGSKEKLLEAIFLKYTSSIRSKVEEIVKDRNAEPTVKIEQIIDAYIDAFIEYPDFYLLLSREQLRTKNHALYNAIRGLKQKNGSMLKAAVKAGEKAGYFRKNIDITMLAQTLFGTVNQTLNNRRYLCEQYDIAEGDQSAFEEFIFPKLREHLKTMFKYYLTNK